MIPKEEGIVSVIDDHGKSYFGHYRVKKGLITLKCKYGSKKAQMFSPDWDPEPLATKLLREIIRERLKK